jgi:hypothetical protein
VDGVEAVAVMGEHDGEVEGMGEKEGGGRDDRRRWHDSGNARRQRHGLAEERASEYNEVAGALGSKFLILVECPRSSTRRNFLFFENTLSSTPNRHSATHYLLSVSIGHSAKFICFFFSPQLFRSLFLQSLEVHVQFWYIF